VGGLGSGRYSTCPTTLDDFQSIDLRYLRRQKLLKPGYSGSLRWSRGGQETASIRFIVGFDDITLSYRVRDRASGNWEDILEPVPLLRTAQPLGGERLWFACPRCCRRCAVLYGGRRFLCRHCVGAPYGSQNEGAHDRLLRRAQAIRLRLDGSASTIEPFPPKPKNMHQKTYDRLARKCEALERAMWQAAARRFGLNAGEGW
jgi:hypothetical protein